MTKSAAPTRAEIRCPVELTLTLLSNKWKALILRDLFIRRSRFSELQKSLAGISQKVLTANLRALEEDGLISRQVFAQVPPRVEYALTDCGRSLLPILQALFKWGAEYQEERGWARREDLPPKLRQIFLADEAGTAA